MKNILTIDVEEYYDVSLCDNDGKYVSTIESNVNDMLTLLKKYNVSATFFVLGIVAEKHPNLIKLIDDFGHNIASHGYKHSLMYNLSEKEFRDDVTKSKIILERIINKKVLGYRAPAWSILQENLYALNILQDMDFVYSSSMFPMKNFLYGISNIPNYPNHPVVNKETLKIYEIPPGTVKLGKRIGFSGGFYFRMFPYFFVKMIIKYYNKKGIPITCYLHTWEIDTNPPKLNIKGINKFIHYYNLKRCRKKFERLLNDFEFISVEKYIDI